MDQSTTRTRRAPRGAHQVKVDATGRLKLPAQYQEHLAKLDEQEIFVTVLFGMIRGYTNGSWERELARLDGNPGLRRKIWEEGDKYGQDVTPDSHGRVTLPQKVRDKVAVENATLQLRFQDESIWMYTEEQFDRVGVESEDEAREMQKSAEEYGFL